MGKKKEITKFKDIVECAYNMIDAFEGKFQVSDLAKYLEAKFPQVDVDDVLKILRIDGRAKVVRGGKQIRLIDA